MTESAKAQAKQGTGRPPIAGIRVLDFTHVLAGPFCTRLLADLGADVLKVESSAKPERMGARRRGSSAPRTREDRTPSFLNINRSKRSIAINLKHPAGRDVAQRLAETADVIVENFSSGVMDRLQLGYDDLQPLNPRLIYASMSGYGHTGPRQAWTSMNMNLQAYAGLMMVTGAEGDPPTTIANSWNDYIGGLHATFAILQALSEREKSGHGRNIDLSQFESSVASLGPLTMSSTVNGTVPPRAGNRSTSVAPQGVYRCAGEDEWCAISVQNDDQWRALADAIGKPEWAADSRFATTSARLEGHDELDAAIESWANGLPKEQVEQRLKRVGVSADRMRRINEVLDPADRAQVFVPWNDPRGGGEFTTGEPFSFSESPLAPPRPAATIGEHTGEALEDWLGLSESEVKALEDDGALV